MIPIATVPWDFYSTVISWLCRAPPSAQHWPLAALLRRVVLLAFIWQGLWAESETALPEREESKYCRKAQGLHCILWPSLLEHSKDLPACCHPLGSSWCCFSEPSVLPPTGCSWCLSSVSSCAPAVSSGLCCRWPECSLPPGNSHSQSLVFAWQGLALLSCFSSQEAGAHARLRAGGCCEAQGAARQELHRRGGGGWQCSHSKTRTTWSFHSTHSLSEG